MWTDWLLPGSSSAILLVVLSTFGMYLTILLLARWSGVRSFAEMSTFDIAVTIAIGSVFATTIASKEPALLQGMAAVATMFTIQLAVSRMRRHFGGFKGATDNTPILLMGPGGVMKPKNMRVARVTEDDLRTHLRQANVLDRAVVNAVVMEGTGKIHVLAGHERGKAAESWILEGVRDYDGESA
ncbi:DUF421 domain-containing protein [Tranquillimonas rosea]|uniref:DUF421 domain-containing protein n=1 Tax=Tranquillimonas rosea TaxID=641238 RepID=UPI003BA9B78A